MAEILVVSIPDLPASFSAVSGDWDGTGTPDPNDFASNMPKTMKCFTAIFGQIEIWVTALNGF